MPLCERLASDTYGIATYNNAVPAAHLQLEDVIQQLIEDTVKGDI